jgi:hypothetical protein
MHLIKNDEKEQTIENKVDAPPKKSSAHNRMSQSFRSLRAKFKNQHPKSKGHSFQAAIQGRSAAQLTRNSSFHSSSSSNTISDLSTQINSLDPLGEDITYSLGDNSKRRNPINDPQPTVEKYKNKVKESRVKHFRNLRKWCAKQKRKVSNKGKSGDLKPPKTNFSSNSFIKRAPQEVSELSLNAERIETNTPQGLSSLISKKITPHLGSDSIEKTTSISAKNWKIPMNLIRREPNLLKIE